MRTMYSMSVLVICSGLLLMSCRANGQGMGTEKSDSAAPRFLAADSTYAVLDSSQAWSVNRLPLCTRSAPVVEGGWLMESEDAQNVDSAVRTLEVDCIVYGARGSRQVYLKPSDYFRQYVGVVVGGRRMVYVNAVHTRLSEDNLGKLYMVCDGGPYQWGALWNPEDGTFTQVYCNAQG